MGAATGKASDPNEKPIDDYRLFICGLPGQSVPAASTFRFSNGRNIRGATVFNQTSINVGLYFSRSAQVGNAPDVICLAGTAQGVPLPAVESLGISFQTPTGTVPTGQCYVHFTTDLVVSTVSQLPALGGAGVWDQSLWDVTSWNY